MGTKYVADAPFQKRICDDEVVYYVGFGDFRPGMDKEVIFVHQDNVIGVVIGVEIEVKRALDFNDADRIKDEKEVCVRNTSVWMPYEKK